MRRRRRRRRVRPPLLPVGLPLLEGGDVALEGVERDAEPGGGLLLEVAAHDGLRAGGDRLDDLGGDAGAGVERVGRGLGGAHGADLEGDERLGLLEDGAEGVGALVADEGVGVLAGREGGDLHGHALLQEEAARADGGVEAGGVAVEDEEGAVGIAFQKSDVLLREGGALRGDGGAEAARVAADDVDLPFADEGLAAAVADDVLAREVERVEDASLVEDGRLGTVDVLGGLGARVEDAPAEADDLARRVADGEHQAAMEAVVVVIGPATLLGRGEDADGDELLGGEAVLRGPGEDGALAVGRVADAEALGRFAVELAGGEVVAGLGGLGDLAEAALVEGGELGVDAEEEAAGDGLVVLGHVERDAAALGEETDGVDEGHAVRHHQELEDVAVRAAAEAVEGAAGGGDDEGGRLLLVEGAAGLEVGRGALERDARADELDDVRPSANLLQGLL